MLCDSMQQYQSEVEESVVANPGARTHARTHTHFHTHTTQPAGEFSTDGSFIVYRPHTKEVEFSQVS